MGIVRARLLTNWWRQTIKRFMAWRNDLNVISKINMRIKINTGSHNENHIILHFYGTSFGIDLRQLCKWSHD